MATTDSPPSPPNPDEDVLPTATLALPAAASSRRLPPPCWSSEETVALIDAYKDKWYALRRGNLRANHWQEVADDVASRCPASPQKTAVQCRHKMEKLRKRYRSEIQRAAAHGGVRRFSSSWVQFQKMHAMERGPNPTPPSSSDDDDDDDHQNSVKRIRDLYNHKGPENNGASVRIKIPGRTTPGPPIPKFTPKFDEMQSKNPNLRYANSVSGANGAASSKVLRDGLSGFAKRGSEIYREKAANPGFDEVIAAIHSLSEGYARTEMAKMDILKQVDQMRMELETKRAEMIIECQQMILEALSDRNVKRARRSSTPPAD